MTGKGQASVTWSARPMVVGRTLAAHSIVFLGAVAPPALVALADGAHDMALALAPSVALGLAGHAAHRRVPEPDDVRKIEAVATFVALFVLVSLSAAPAFLALGMPFTDAVFESVSGVTSTGLTVAAETEQWPFAGHFLRAWLQWSGAFAIAVAGVALILGPGGASHEMGEIGINGRDLIASTRLQARQLLIAYCLITIVALAVLVPIMPTRWEGVVLALTAVSTGGFTPRADSLASYSTSAQNAVLAFCVSTTMSLYFYVLARQSGVRQALRKANCGAVLKALATGAALAAALKFAVDDWRTDQVLETTLNFVSGFTTAGFSVAPVAEADAVLALILVGMLIGGGIGSTAGGIKLDRALTLARMVRLSLVRLRAPRRAVTRLMANGRRVAADRIIAVGAIIVLYVLTGFLAWVAFLAAGSPPLGSLFDIVSALSTVGLSSGVTGPDLADPLKLVLIVAMLAGRLEFLALIVVILPSTWTNTLPQRR
ncbi:MULTISPECIES: potassium transporter TrkG [unclassified Roseitalea]|uniref:potassium transporter TrkG n=1 Tax=unclassified Roseitalea TaxID=2639107 RepID=UPI00273D0F74|nr:MULTISPECIES: potassium transporter TrkG [unclassified Roseitalea]